ncbi:hypothetical protein DFH06DRAFT_1475807 [Mycena polygramma]|nr:hypothetical protein DFH06DRAFT_1475807 [Mycena polygramma]
MSDSDLDDEEDEEEQTDAPSNVASASSSSTGEVSFAVVPGVTISTPRRMGRVVPVKGHAFKTWNAPLYYLYTNKIRFRSSESASQAPDCSAKSMYKLADKVKLIVSVLQDIQEHHPLSTETIVHEAFSSFTSLYPEIQDMEVEFLLKHLPNLREGMGEMLRTVCDEGKPHCFGVLHKIVCRAGWAGTAAGAHGVHRRSSLRTTLNRLWPQRMIGGKLCQTQPLPPEVTGVDYLPSLRENLHLSFRGSKL